MACWDIIGKAADQPVYNLLGGKAHERLRSYAYIYPAGGDVYPDTSDGHKTVYDDPDMAAERAVHYLAQGFTALKFDPAGPYHDYDGHQPDIAALDRSEAFCKRLRKRLAIRPICCSAPTVSSRSRARNVWHGGSRPTTLFGSRSQFRRIIPS